MLPSKCNKRSAPPKPKLRISSSHDLMVKSRPLLRIVLSAWLSCGVDAKIAREIARLCVSTFSLAVLSKVSGIEVSPRVSY